MAKAEAINGRCLGSHSRLCLLLAGCCGCTAFSDFTPTEQSARLFKTYGEVEAFKNQLVKAETRLKAFEKTTDGALFCHVSGTGGHIALLALQHLGNACTGPTMTFAVDRLVWHSGPGSIGIGFKYTAVPFSRPEC